MHILWILYYNYYVLLKLYVCVDPLFQMLTNVTVIHVKMVEPAPTMSTHIAVSVWLDTLERTVKQASNLMLHYFADMSFISL